MTYNVFGGTLSLTQSINQSSYKQQFDVVITIFLHVREVCMMSQRDSEVVLSHSWEVRRDWLQQVCSLACYYLSIEMMQRAASVLLQCFILFIFHCRASAQCCN